MTRRFALASSLCLALPALAAPRLVEGVLDLRGYDFEREGPVTVDGTWRVMWGALTCDVSPSAPVVAFGFWGHGPTPSPTGAASYGMRVLLDAPRALGLFGGYVMNAARVCVDGVPVAALGAPGLDASSTVPAKGPVLAPFAAGTSVDVVLQLANHHAALGGLAFPPRLGTAEQARDETSWALAQSFAVLGALAIIGLYNLVIFFFRRDTKAPLWLAAFCFAAGLREYVLEHQALHDASTALFSGWMKLEYAGVPGAPAVLLAFVATAFPNMVRRRVVDVLVALGALGVVFVLVSAPMTFSSALTGLQAVALAEGLAVLAVVGRAALVRRDRAAQLSLMGFALLFGTLLKDVLQAQGLAVDGRFYVPLGLVRISPNVNAEIART